MSEKKAKISRVAEDSELLDRIKEHEGYRRFVYECSTGHKTIGYGTMIEPSGHGIPRYIAELLLRDYLTTIESLLRPHEWFCDLNTNRQHCILEMAYQMGVDGVLGFKNMISSLSAESWDDAEMHALDSLWARQTPKRAQEVARRLRQG